MCTAKTFDISCSSHDITPGIAQNCQHLRKWKDTIKCAIVERKKCKKDTQKNQHFRWIFVWESKLVTYLTTVNGLLREYTWSSVDNRGRYHSRSIEALRQHYIYSTTEDRCRFLEILSLTSSQPAVITDAIVWWRWLVQVTLHVMSSRLAQAVIATLSIEV